MFTEDINYLKNSGISKILSKGLAETYLVQPNSPVEFFANWLLRFSQIEKQKENQKIEDEKIARKQDIILINEYNLKMEQETENLKKTKLKQEQIELISQLAEVT